MNRLAYRGVAVDSRLRRMAWGCKAPSIRAGRSPYSPSFTATLSNKHAAGVRNVMRKTPRALWERR